MNIDETQNVLRKSRYVFITGTYRSGTTLLNHLFDAHPDLLVFPVENCIFRDCCVHQMLPNPEGRNLDNLKRAMKSRDIGRILGIMFDHEKLGLPLSQTIAMDGSVGNQDVPTTFDREIFVDAFTRLLQESGSQESYREKDIFQAYTIAWFLAVGVRNFDAFRYIVNKCPEAGLCISLYLDYFPHAKIVHIIRDPRDIMASHKGRQGKEYILPFSYFDLLVKRTNDALKAYDSYQTHDRVCVLRYEDLVRNTEDEMRKVAAFLGIPYEASMIQPSILGQPWLSNSVDEKNRAVSTVYVETDKFRKKLTPLEIQMIESECGVLMKKSGYDLSYDNHHAAAALKLKYTSCRMISGIYRKIAM